MKRWLAMYTIIGGLLLMKLSVRAESKVVSPTIAWQSLISAIENNDTAEINSLMSPSYRALLIQTYPLKLIPSFLDSVDREEVYGDVGRVLVVPPGTSNGYWMPMIRMGEKWMLDFDERKLLQEVTKDWYTTQSEHFVFHFSQEHGITMVDMEENEADFRRIAFALGVDIQEKIEYYFAQTSEDMLLLFGRTTGAGEGRKLLVKADVKSQPHELTHVLLFEIAPNGSHLLQEGIAQYFFGNPSVEDKAKASVLSGKIVDIQSIVDNNSFRELERESYYVAASFLRFLITHYGLQKVRELYIQTVSGDFGETTKRVYGSSLTELTQEWKEQLLGR